MAEEIRLIRKRLESNVDELTKSTAQRYFKETVRLYGVGSALVGKIAADSFQSMESKSKAEIFALCEELWTSGMLEESFIACEWSYRLRSFYSPEDIHVFERWIDNWVDNWASCDTLCNHSVGSLVEGFPQNCAVLKQWTCSGNRWKRRAAAVSLVVPARKGAFLGECLEIASLLLEDDDDLVRKGYGWMLKEASRTHQDEVFAFVMQHKARMPRTALRYAIEKMPPEMKRLAMEK
jgi:3-methyladenine DNA glycosylase AlkD